MEKRSNPAASPLAPLPPDDAGRQHALRGQDSWKQQPTWKGSRDMAETSTRAQHRGSEETGGALGLAEAVAQTLTTAVSTTQTSDVALSL